MHAIRIHAPGGPDALRVDSVPVPRPGVGEVLVRVEYAGVNFIDVYKRTGLYRVPLPSTLGEEGAGIVEALGDGLAEAQLKAGDRVAWAGVLGAYAEFALIPVAKLVPLPKDVSSRDGAAVMLQGLTAHYLSHTTYPLRIGDRALVHAAAGGVGLLLIQMAKRRGAYVIGTVGSDDKAAVARAVGADDVIVYTRDDFVAATKRITEGRGVQVVFDSVGQSTFLKGLETLAPRGSMVLFGAASGPVAPIDPQLLNQKGSLFLTRPTLAHYIATREELLWRAGELFAGIGAGELDVRIGAEFPLTDVARAHEALEGRRTTGKVVLRVR